MRKLLNHRRSHQPHFAWYPFKLFTLPALLIQPSIVVIFPLSKFAVSRNTIVIEANLGSASEFGLAYSKLHDQLLTSFYDSHALQTQSPRISRHILAASVEPWFLLVLTTSRTHFGRL